MGLCHMSFRCDRTPIDNYEELPDGRLRVRATFSRVGPLDYLRSDGSIQTEYLEADELFRTDSLDTAGLAAVTLGHPDEGFVTPKNWRKYAVGASGSTVTANRQDGLVDVVFLVGDEDAIDAIKKKKATQVSAGYSTTVEQRSDGKFYQTNRIYNHLALVERGRAGPDVKVHFDGLDDVAIQADSQEVKTDMAKYKGMDMSEEAMDAFQKMEADMAKMKEDMKGMKSKADEAEAVTMDKLQGEIDGYKTKIDALEQQLESRLDADQVTALATARLSAFEEVKGFIPDAKFDAALEPIAWRKAAIAAVNPSLNLDGRSDDYINGVSSTLVSLKSTVDNKSDAQGAAEFKQVLDAAAVSGHSGKSAERADEYKEDADEIAAINNLFTGAK